MSSPRDFAFLVFFGLMLTLSSCGKDRQKNGDAQIAWAEEQLNTKQYESAIYILSKIHPEILRSRGKDDLIGYAYLGLLKLDGDSVYEIVYTINQRSDEKLTRPKLDEIMAKIPILDDEKMKKFNFS